MFSKLAPLTLLLSSLSCLASPLASNSSMYAPTNTSSLCPPGGTTKYPSQSQIYTIFHYLETGPQEQFFAHIIPNVNWADEGTHPLAGEYYNRDYFIQNTITRLDNLASSSDPLKIRIVNIIGGCDEEWSAVELQATGHMKNGLNFDNRYSWNVKWSSQCTIVQARAYLDSEPVKEAVLGNENPDYTYYDFRTPT